MDMRCEEIREMLPAFAGTGEDTLAFRRHLAGCERCRSEAEQYQELTGALGSLSAIHAEPPADLLPALLAVPERARRSEVLRRHVVRNRKAYAGGLAVALVGAAGAAVWRSRARGLATA
jgi:anti-sigma factor RsiW